jgi:hypothetical protein
MNIFLSLDYELFLQDPGINIAASLIDPTKRLNEMLEKNSLNAVYFVDAGYIAALNRQKLTYHSLQIDYNKIIEQLQDFNLYGHEIGLHIHPHWEDTFFDGNRWRVNLARYKLADFRQEEASTIFKHYFSVLQDHASTKIVSYRAGGWCLEPFSHISSAMRECGIFIDSTVFQDGRKQTATHSFDFRGYPKKDMWRFDNHPSIEDKDGFFLELPSTSYTLSPTVFWRLLFNSILKKVRKNDSGYGVKPSITEALRKLFLTRSEAVSIDSIKSDNVLKSFKSAEKEGRLNFCIIGHPKCFTDDTYKNLAHFIDYALSQGHQFKTFSSAFQPSHDAPLSVRAV